MKISNRHLFLSSLVALLAGTSSAQAPSQRINLGADPDAPHSAYDVRLATAGSSVHAIWAETRDVMLTSYGLYYNRSLDHGATWMASDVQIGSVSEPGLSVGEHQIAVHGDLVSLVWAEIPGGPHSTLIGVFANRSDDGGETWLASNRRVSEDLDQSVSSPAMAMVGTSVYAVWVDDRDGASAIYLDRSLDGGATWMPDDVRVASSSGFPVRWSYPFTVDLAASGTTLYVVWEDDRNNYPDDACDVYFNRSLDGGLTWLPADVRLDIGSPLTGDSRNPRIAAQGSAVYVVWEDDLFGQRDVLFNRSLDGGDTWLSRALRLDRGSSLGASDSRMPVVAAADSAVFVAWSDERDGAGDVYFNRSLDGGTTWMTPDVRLDTGDEPGSVYSYAPHRIAIEGQSLLVAWRDWKQSTGTEPGFSRVGFNRSLDDGDTWLPAHVFVSDGDRATGETVLATGASSAYVAWTDSRHPSGWSDVYFTMPLGHQPYGAGTPGTGGFVPTFAADGLPFVGDSFAFEVENGRGGATVAVLYGLDGKAALPLAGGTWLVQGFDLLATAVLGGTPGAAGEGTASIPIPVPNNLNMIGLRVNSQGVVLDPAGSLGVALTSALETWIL